MHCQHREFLHSKTTNNWVSCFYLFQLLADSFIFEGRRFLFWKYFNCYSLRKLINNYAEKYEIKHVKPIF